MSLVSSLFTGVTGLASNSEAMGVIGDNISNVNTIGFKGSKAVFSDIFSSVLSNGSTTSQLGRGAQLSGTLRSLEQGSFEASNNALDLAIDGAGFFIVNNGTGNFYTRAGQFRMNDDGKVQAITGEVLQGSKITAGVASTTTENIDLAGVQSLPQASSTFELGANLNSAATATSTFNSPITIYNSVGDQVLMNVQFTKTTTANKWTYAITTSKGAITSGASGSVTFGTNGQLTQIGTGTTVADQTIVINHSASTPVAETQTLTWDVATEAGASSGKLTGFAASSNNNSVTQNGYSTGSLASINVDATGIIKGLFSNGQTSSLYQVAMADFLAPTGLTRQGSNLFAESATSGQAVIGTAQTGGFGSIIGSSLELSNVDLAEQFVALIQTQQAFQASARMITTTDDLLTEAVNLVR
ncbi:MAG: flagellar hook protein FlgE [Nitrospinota bacterium]|nr:flagellar hook protein FlgE [Nitrospinota bacterium]MEC8957322.1 flagellar hook protein FlgE [Nitrospinota bacterium]MED5353167.1 flagellar hook protein FlgE [Nitrospinota bacterium]